MGGRRRTTMEEPCAISAATSGAESLHRSNGVQFFGCSCAVCDIGFLFATPGLFDQNGLPTALQSALKRSSSSGGFHMQVVDSSVGLRLQYLPFQCCLMVVPNGSVRPIYDVRPICEGKPFTATAKNLQGLFQLWGQINNWH